MAKKTNKKILRQPSDKKLVVIVLLITTLIIASFLLKNFIFNKSDGKNINAENEKYGEWLAGNENCRCFEKERITCPDNFEFINGLCRNEAEKTYTNFLKSCSKYECSGEIVSWMGESWEPKIN